MRKKLQRHALYTVLVVLFGNLLAYKFYWYSSIWWYDMAIHALGGVFLALLCSIIFYKHLNTYTYIETCIHTLLFVVIVVLGWEIFEYVVQMILKPIPFANIPDSISDVICGIAGGIIGTFFVLLTKKRYNSTHDNI